MKRILFWCILLLVAWGTAFASGIALYSALPNTDDDAALEYIELWNDGCEEVSLAWVTLRDASGKTFTISSGILSPWDIRRIPRSESKIILNNSEETLEILDASGQVVQHVSYATSERNTPISFAVPTTCEVETVTEVVEFSHSSGSTTPPGTQSQSGSILEYASTSFVESSTGSTSSSTGTTASGVALSSETQTGVTQIVTSTGMVMPLEGIPLIEPIWLRIFDSDGNQKIDRLEVQYSGVLSGSVASGGVLISSATGWLASSGIQTGTGVIRELSYSGSILHILLFEQDKVWTTLRITSDTSSHLRLKTVSPFGLLDIWGRPVIPITLTQSFSGYTSVTNEALPPISSPLSFSSSAVPSIPLPSPPLLQSSSWVLKSSSTWGTLILTGASVPSNQKQDAPRNIPDPLIVIQSGLSSRGRCMNQSCKINVRHPVLESFERCRWTLDPVGELGGTIDGCNPRAFDFPEGGWAIQLTVYDEKSPSLFRTNTLLIWAFLSPVLSSEPQPTSASSAPPKIVSEMPPKAVSKTASVQSSNPSMQTNSKKTTTKTTKKTSPSSSQKVSSESSTPKESVKPSSARQVDPEGSSMITGIIGILCAGIGFAVALFRSKIGTIQ